MWCWHGSGSSSRSPRPKHYQRAEGNFYHGKWQACRYFFLYELPKVDAMLELVESLDTTTLEMQDAWF